MIKKIKGFTGRVVNWKDYVLMAVSIYLFVSSIEMIKVSAKALGHGGVDYIVSLIRGPITGVFAGWFGTALVQSSGAFDSIVLGNALRSPLKKHAFENVKCVPNSFVGHCNIVIEFDFKL